MPSSPAWPSDQSRDLSPTASGGLTPLSPPSELQEIPVAIREQSGVLCFHSRGMPVSPGASGMQPRDPGRPWRGALASGHKPTLAGAGGEVAPGVLVPVEDRVNGHDVAAD